MASLTTPLEQQVANAKKAYQDADDADADNTMELYDCYQELKQRMLEQDNEASVAAGAQWANDHVMGTTASVEKGDADDIPITAIPDGGLDNLMRLIERLDPSLDDQVRTALSNHPDAVDTLRRWGYVQVQEEEAHEALLPKPKDKEELQ